MALTPPSPAAPDVRAWHADISVFRDAATLGSALRWLDAGERERYDRFARDEDRLMFLLGRVMARRIVGDALGVGPADWRWRMGPRGRPEVDDADARVRFNLTHSGGVVVCALAWNRDVGADVEHLHRRPVEFAVVERYCSPEEVADIAACGDAWHDRFLVYWTLKEAYLKARGVGIALPLAEISFDLAATPRIAFTGTLAGTDARWRFHLSRPLDSHLIAIAAATPDDAALAFHVEPFAHDRLPA